MTVFWFFDIVSREHPGIDPGHSFVFEVFEDPGAGSARYAISNAFCSLEYALEAKRLLLDSRCQREKAEAKESDQRYG